MTRLTKEQIIDETVEYYSAEPGRRAFDGESCKYYDEKTGNMCAVGRCLLNPKDFKENYEGVEILLGFGTGTIDHVLKPQYRGHEVEFWVALQMLHDFFNHWCKEGLTELGKNFVDKLKIEWT